MTTPVSPVAAPVTIVVQLRVAPRAAQALTTWQQETGDVLDGAPGFVDQAVISPSPPLQVDWVLLYRFTEAETARTWLESDAWRRQLAAVQPLVDGELDVSLVGEDAATPVTVMIATHVVAGADAAYQEWVRRMDTAQAHFPGYLGYKLIPPVPGVQDDWVTLLRFDSEEHLRAWMDSPERQRLLDEAKAFTAGFRARAVRSGFDQWFPAGAPALAPVWKQNMLVLLALYPVVYLFGVWVGTPLLGDRLGLPFWLALFIGNIVSIIALNGLVPWLSGCFAWWLQPAGAATAWTNVRGFAVLVLLYAGLLLLCSRLT